MSFLDQKRGGLTMINRASSAVLVIITAVLYQNCAPAQLEPPAAAFIEPEDLNRVATQALKASGGQNVCQSLSAYLCEARVYAPDAETANRSEFICESETDLSSCYEVLRLSYNTRANIDACPECSPQDIKERYDHQEFICMNRRIRAAGTLPVRAEGDSLMSALISAREACLNLASRK